MSGQGGVRLAWRAALGLMLAAVLAGCAGTGGGGEREIRTASDLGDAEKRARVRLELAGLYFGRGQPTTALDEIKRALAAKPALPEAYSLRGLVYGSMGEVALAEESFQRALQLAPRDGDTMHNFGWFLCQQRRWPEADTQFANALAQPGYREQVRTLLAQGVCQARAGRWAEAERTLSRSYELDPGNPFTAYNLSDVLLQRGELERARFYIARVNVLPEQTTAQSLWLALRIERRLGDVQRMQELARRLRERFPQADEVMLLDQGRFE
jgi:type IV pilus assembly protein PilF